MIRLLKGEMTFKFTQIVPVICDDQFESVLLVSGKSGGIGLVKQEVVLEVIFKQCPFAVDKSVEGADPRKIIRDLKGYGLIFREPAFIHKGNRPDFRSHGVQRHCLRAERPDTRGNESVFKVASLTGYFIVPAYL